MIAELPYAELQCMLDDPPGYRNYWTAEYLDTLPDDAVGVFCSRAGDMISPSPSQLALLPQGGAVARSPAEYPLPWRHAPWVVHPFGMWEDPADDERGKQWARDIRTDLKPWVNGAVYLNFIGDEGQDRIVAGLGRENYERLAPNLRKALQARQDAIRSELERAEQARLEAEQRREQYERQIASAGGEADRLIRVATEAGEVLRRERIEKAEGEALQIVEKARADAAGERDRAFAELRAGLADISIEAATRVLRTEAFGPAGSAPASRAIHRIVLRAWEGSGEVRSVGEASGRASSTSFGRRVPTARALDKPEAQVI
jgi:F0F1-type ATP synthase membrane subunit b/b'